MIAVSDRKNDITWVSIMDQKNMNGTITNYTYNGLGRITSANGSPYTYDNNGNLLTKGSETFTYDWKNNLVRYQNSTTVEDVWLGYDIGNTLVAKGWTEEGGVGVQAAAASSSAVSRRCWTECLCSHALRPRARQTASRISITLTSGSTSRATTLRPCTT
ncbi:MAG: hypothetical protein U5N86_07850 [Planctomycetota bacterium]|nr:hypothetical protein [Planctomycetota bacterium]